MNDGVGPLALLALFGVVAFGSVVPVVPTGATVSAAAVLARGEHPWELVIVIVIGAAGAYFGDIATYGMLRIAGMPLAQRIGWKQKDDPQAALQRIRHGIEEHELRTLLVSRLVPGGRIPVLVAAALGGYPWQRYAGAAVLAALLWAVTYTVVGVVGDSMFADPQEAIIAAVVGAMLLTVVAQLVQRHRR